MRKVLNAQKCHRYAYYEGEKVQKVEGKGATLTIAMREVFKESSLSDLAKLGQRDIERRLLTKVNREDYLMSKEFELEKEILSAQIMYAAASFLMAGYKEVASDVLVKMTLLGTEMNVKFDKIVEDPTGLLVGIKFERRESPHAILKTAKSRPSIEMEYYLMLQAMKELYPNARVNAGKFFLTSKSSKRMLQNNADNFSYSTEVDIHEKLVVPDWSTDIAKDDADELWQKLRAICATSLTRFSNKTEDSKECELCSYKYLCNYFKNTTDKNEPLKIDKASSFKSLSNSQKKVVEVESGVSRIIATAGSGKTTTLINRVIRLLEKGCQPKDVLLITFTEKGVREIKDKLEFWCQKENLVYGAEDFHVYTFNGFGDRIIKENYMELGYTEEPTLISSVDAIEIMAEILDDAAKIPGLNYRKPTLVFQRAKGAVTQSLDIVKKIRDEGITKEEDLPRGVDVAFLDIAAEFEAMTKLSNKIEYADQIWVATQALYRPSVRRKYEYKHVIVDECQDTSTIQLEIVKILAAKAKSLMVCGDPAQAIFGFRGVGPKNLLEFTKHYPNCKDYYLKENFRSTTSICNLAMKVLANHKEAIPTKMISAKGMGSRVTSVSCDKSDYPKETLKAIKKYVKKGDQYGEIAVLARSRAELFEVAKVLNTNNVPYDITVGEPLKENAFVRGIAALINFLCLEDEQEANLLEFAEWVQIADEKFATASRDLNSYISREMGIIKEKTKDMNDDELFEFVKAEAENKISDTATVNQFFYILEENKVDTIKSASQFMKRIMKYNITDLTLESSNSNTNSVKLSTIHAAKGREWKDVVLLAFNLTGRSDFDEEVRLAFVGITRAMDNLTLLGRGKFMLGETVAAPTPKTK